MSGRKPITQCTRREWDDLCRKARASVPPPLGYRWRFEWSEKLAAIDDEGEADMRPRPGYLEDGQTGRAIVRVARGLSREHTLDTLIHEIAHCRDSWAHDGTRGDHDSHYWLVVGEVWHAMKGTRTG